MIKIKKFLWLAGERTRNVRGELQQIESPVTVVFFLLLNFLAQGWSKAMEMTSPMSLMNTVKFDTRFFR